MLTSEFQPPPQLLLLVEMNDGLHAMEFPILQMCIFLLNTEIMMVPESHADCPIYQHFSPGLTFIPLSVIASEIMVAELKMLFIFPK